MKPRSTTSTGVTDTRGYVRVKPMPDNGEDRDRLSLDEVFQTFQESGGIDDDDFAAATRVPMPRKPNRNDAAIALPEPDENERDS